MRFLCRIGLHRFLSNRQGYRICLRCEILQRWCPDILGTGLEGWWVEPY